MYVPLVRGSPHLFWTLSPAITTFHLDARLDNGAAPSGVSNGPFYSGSVPSFSEISIVLHHLDSQGSLEGVEQ